MDRRALLSALALAGIAAACAGTPVSLPSAERRGGTDATPEHAEDARPTVYAEDEVDVPATPALPIEPRYPPRMRQLGVEGTVECRVLVWADGSLGGAELLASSHDDFTRAMRDALAASRFHPARRGGHPVPSTVTLRVHFELED